MKKTQRAIKVISLVAISYILFVLFVFNFRVVTIEALFSINNFAWYMFLISLISASFFVNALIYFSEEGEHYIWFSVFLISVCILTGSFFLLKEFENSVILSIIVCLAFIPSILIPINARKNYIKINSFTIFGRIQRYTTLFLALSFALSFYFYENLDTNNPHLANFMNTFVSQTTNNVLKTVGITTTDNSTKVAEENPRIQFIKDKLEKEIGGLSGKSLETYNQNKGLLDGLFNTYINSEIEKVKSEDSPFTKGIKETVNNFINSYRPIILVVGSILVYFFITSAFYFSGIITIPLFTFIYYILVKIGFFEKVKKEVVVERIEL